MWEKMVFPSKTSLFYIKPHYFTFTKQSIRKGSRYENSILHEFFLKMTFSLVWIYVANSRGPIEKGWNGLLVILIELPWMRDPRFTPSYLNAGSYVGNGTLCFMWQNVAKWNHFFTNTLLVYPYVVMEEKKNHYILTNENYIDIILFLETSGFSYL